MADESLRNILHKYERKLGENVDLDNIDLKDNKTFSMEYDLFRKSALSGTDSFYENTARLFGNIITLRLKPEEEKELEKAIEFSHLHIKPSDVLGFALFFGIGIILLALLILLISFVPVYFSSSDSGRDAALEIQRYTGQELIGADADCLDCIYTYNTGTNSWVAKNAKGQIIKLNDDELESLKKAYQRKNPIDIKETPKPLILIPLLLMILGVLLIKPLSKLPIYLANKRRLAASNQMVVCILYIIIYMRHTSNLEHAIKFAGDHIGNPLALDLRKIFWDVEADKFSTIKESIDNYLVEWRDYNLEFVESFHLVESSLYESSDQKRIELLEKALEVILNGTHERMLHFAHDLKSPMTVLYMLGIVLPILGLVLFPLLGSFLHGLVRWYHLAILYNLILPVGVFIFGYNMLVKRPTGYSENIIISSKEDYGNGAGFIAGVLLFVFLIIGLLPIILHFTNPELDQASFGEGTLEIKYLDFKCDETGCMGPFGAFALILSMFIPLGIALSLGIYYKVKTKEIMMIRNKTKNLEKEFIGSLFQLGNRVGSGIPVEIAFSRVAEDISGTPTGEFFKIISINLTKLGMSVKEAIFNQERGAILMFPSGLVETSMRVLIESARRGPIVVSKSMISISEYVSKIHAVNERLKDLLADLTSSMKSQISFMTPMIAGIVVGVASMVVSIINKLGEQIANGTTNAEDLGGLGSLMDILDTRFIIPSYHFQLIVGLYVVEIIVILTYLNNAIENGLDDIAFKNSLGKNLLFGMALYFIISFIGIIVFTILAMGIGMAT